MSDDSMPFGCAVAIIGVAIVGFAVSCGIDNTGKHWETCHVTSKDRAKDMRVYTDDCGVLKNDDNRLQGKTNSGDIWGQIQPNKTYRFQVVGHRWSTASKFSNILSVQEIK